MKIKKLHYSSHFEKSFKKLPINVQKRTTTKLKIFQENPFNTQLKTHKLSGKLAKYWSFSVDYSYRIVFEFITDEEIGLVDIGTHRVYR